MQTTKNTKDTKGSKMRSSRLRQGPVERILTLVTLVSLRDSSCPSWFRDKRSHENQQTDVSPISQTSL